VRGQRVGRLVGVVSTVDAALEGQVTIALYDVLEGQLVEGWHLLEDERVIPILVRVE
jgi:hypothetical protein